MLGWTTGPGGTHRGHPLLIYIGDQGWWALDAFGRCFNLRVLLWTYGIETSSQVTWSNNKDNTSPKCSPCSWSWEKVRFPCAIHKGLRCCKIYRSAIGTAPDTLVQVFSIFPEVLNRDLRGHSHRLIPLLGTWCLTEMSHSPAFIAPEKWDVTCCQQLRANKIVHTAAVRQ